MKRSFYLIAAIGLFLYLCLVLILEFLLPPVTSASFRFVFFASNFMFVFPQDSQAVLSIVRMAVGLAAVPMAILALRGHFYAVYGNVPLRRMFSALLAVYVFGSLLSDLTVVVNMAKPVGLLPATVAAPLATAAAYLAIGVFLTGKIKMKTLPHRIFAGAALIYGAFFVYLAVSGIFWPDRGNAFLEMIAGSAMCLISIGILINAFRTMPKFALSKHDREMAEFIERM